MDCLHIVVVMEVAWVLELYIHLNVAAAAEQDRSSAVVDIVFYEAIVELIHSRHMQHS